MIGNSKDVIGKEFNSPDVKSTSLKVLVSSKEGWEDYVMREVEVGESGYTPKHSHPWPHINYFLEGEGELMINGQVSQVFAGSFAHVPNDVLHQYRNIGKGLFKFICIVPKEGHKY